MTKYKPEYTFDDLWNDIMEHVPMVEDKYAKGFRGRIYTKLGRLGEIGDGGRAVEIVMSDVTDGDDPFRTVHVIETDYSGIDAGEIVQDYVHIVHETDKEFGGICKIRMSTPIIEYENVEDGDAVGFEMLLTWAKLKAVDERFQWTDEPLSYLPKILHWE